MDFTQNLTNIIHPGSAEVSQKANILDKIIAWGLRLTLFLVPLFFLPWTFEPFELNKQLLLLILTILLFILWVSKAVFVKHTEVKKSILNWLVLAWLLVVILATIFSVDPITSIFGFYGRFNGGLISLVAYVLLFFMVVNSVKSVFDASKIISWLLCSFGIATLTLILHLFGVNIFNFSAAQLANFTLFGASLNAVVLILAASIPLVIWFTREAKNIWFRILSIIYLMLAILAMVLIDYQLGWIAAIVGLLVWLILVFIKNESVGFNWTMLPSLLLLISVIAWPIVVTGLIRVRTPIEVNLATSASWKIAWQNVMSKPILGTGPETFIFNFSQFRPESFNKTDFWAFRFDKAGSEFVQVLSTTGFVGFVIYLTLFITALFLAWRLIKDKNSEDWYFKAALVASFLTLLVGQVIYFANTAIAIFLWLILAIITSLSSTKIKSISLVSSPRAGFLFSFSLALVILIGLGIFYGAGRFWLADMAYAQARISAQKTEGLDKASDSLREAITLNPWRDVYRVTYAQVLLAQANSLANQAPGKTDQEKTQQIQRLQLLISSSIEQTKAATTLGPENVANWEALGSIYRSTVIYAQGAEKFAIDSYAEAIKRDPTNPALYTELGKAYLISGNRLKDRVNIEKDEANKLKLQEEASKQFTLAFDQFEKAIKLKDTYTPAHFNQVLTYESQGKLDLALAKLETMRQYNPRDIDVLFQLGSLYFNKTDYDKAINVYQTIIVLVPNHGIARANLALTYEKKGDIDKAINEFETILNTPGLPENDRKIIEDKINSLKNPPTSGEPTKENN